MKEWSGASLCQRLLTNLTIINRDGCSLSKFRLWSSINEKLWYMLPVLNRILFTTCLLLSSVQLVWDQDILGFSPGFKIFIINCPLNCIPFPFMEMKILPKRMGHFPCGVKPMKWSFSSSGTKSENLFLLGHFFFKLRHLKIDVMLLMMIFIISCLPSFYAVMLCTDWCFLNFPLLWEILRWILLTFINFLLMDSYFCWLLLCLVNYVRNYRRWLVQRVLYITSIINWAL